MNCQKGKQLSKEFSQTEVKASFIEGRSFFFPPQSDNAFEIPSETL